MKEATFRITDIIYKKNKSTNDYLFKFKKIYLDQRIEIDGNEFIPDIIIEFDEPSELASKWNHKMLVEIVEENETHGEKIEAYRKLGYGVIEIDYTPSFDIFEKKKFFDITSEDINELTWKIRNYYKKSIWSKLIVDPTSEEYQRTAIESPVMQENLKLQEEIKALKLSNRDLSNRVQTLDDSLKKQNQLCNRLTDENCNLKDFKYKSIEKIKLYESVIDNWNSAHFINKLFCGFKVKRT